jgi:PKD repeat protein
MTLALAARPPAASAQFSASATPTLATASFSFHETVVAGSGYGIQFTDTTSGSIASRIWSFGDGATSYAASPFHPYASDGTYSVCLAVFKTDSSLPLSKCQSVRSRRLPYTIDVFLAGYAGVIATPTQSDAYWSEFLDYAFVSFTLEQKDSFLELMRSNPSAGDILAWLTNAITQDYKPFLYFYVGLDVCEALGFPLCNVGPVEYVYFDLHDVVEIVDGWINAVDLDTIYPGGNPDADDGYITTYYAQALSAGFGPTAGIGLAFVPWPTGAPHYGNPHPADFDFNSLSGSTPWQVFDNAVTGSVACGLSFDEDGGFGIESSCGAGLSSQMVRVDLKAQNLYETMSAGLQCAVDALSASGQAYGGPIDNLRALATAFRLDPLSDQPFRVECAATGETVLDPSYRDVSWGPLPQLLRWFAQFAVDVDITSVSQDAAGKLTVTGTVTFFGNSLLRFDFVAEWNAGGGTLWVGRGHLAMDVSVTSLAPGLATLSGTLYWGGTPLAGATLTVSTSNLSAGFHVAVTGASFTLGGFGLSVDVSGDVSLSTDAAGVSASLSGTTRARVTITIGSWSAGFDVTLSTGPRSFSWDGEATVPVPYPVVQYTNTSVSYPCGTKWCKACKWGICSWYPCGTKWCSKTVAVPTGLATATADVCVDFFDPPYCE